MSGNNFPSSTTVRITDTTELFTLLISQTEDLLYTTDFLRVLIWEYVLRRSRQYRQQVLENPDRFDELVESDEDFPEELELLLRCEERLEKLVERSLLNKEQLLIILTYLKQVPSASEEEDCYQTLLTGRKTQVEIIQQMEKTYVTLDWVIHKKINTAIESEKVAFRSTVCTDGSALIITKNGEQCIQGGWCQVGGCHEPIFSATTNMFLCYEHSRVSTPTIPILSPDDVEKTLSKIKNSDGTPRVAPSCIRTGIEQSQKTALKADKIIGSLLEHVPGMRLEVEEKGEGLFLADQVDGPLRDIIDNIWKLRAMKESEQDVMFAKVYERREQLSKLSKRLIVVWRRLCDLKEWLAGRPLVEDSEHRAAFATDSGEVGEPPLEAMWTIKELGKHVVNTCDRYRRMALRHGEKKVLVKLGELSMREDSDTQLYLYHVPQDFAANFTLPEKICMAQGCWKYVSLTSSPKDQFCHQHHENRASTDASELDASFVDIDDTRGGQQVAARQKQRDRAIEYFGKYMVIASKIYEKMWKPDNPTPTIAARGIMDDDSNAIIRTSLGGVSSVRVRGIMCSMDNCLQQGFSLVDGGPSNLCYNHLMYKVTASLLFDELVTWNWSIGTELHRQVYTLNKDLDNIRKRLPSDLRENLDFLNSFRKTNEAMNDESSDNLSEEERELVRLLHGTQLKQALDHARKREKTLLQNDMRIRMIIMRKIVLQLQDNTQEVSCYASCIPYHRSLKLKQSESDARIYSFLAQFGRLGKLVEITNADFRTCSLAINLLETLLNLETKQRTTISERDTLAFVEVQSLLLKNIPEISERLAQASFGAEDLTDLRSALARAAEFIHPQITVRDVLIEYVHLAARAGRKREAVSIITTLHDNLDNTALQVVLEMIAVCLSRSCPDCLVPRRLISSLSDRLKKEDYIKSGDGENKKRKKCSTTLSVSSQHDSDTDDTANYRTEVHAQETATETPTLSSLLQEKKSELVAVLSKSIFLYGLHEVIDNTEEDEDFKQVLHDHISRHARLAEIAEVATNIGTSEFLYEHWHNHMLIITSLQHFPNIFLEQRKLNTKRWDTRSFSETYSNLHPEIHKFLDQAISANWNFIPEQHQYQKYGLSCDLEYVLASTCRERQNHSRINKSQSDLLLECVELAFQEDKNVEATAMILLDFKAMEAAFGFWPMRNIDEHFLGKVALQKGVEFSPQFLVWYVKELNELGEFYTADAMIDALLITVRYENDDQAGTAGAKCLALRAEIETELGGYKDAACDLAGALEFNALLDAPDSQFEAECLDSFIDIIRNLSENEIAQLEKKVSFGHNAEGEYDLESLTMALNKRARKLTDMGSPFYFIRLVKTAALRFDQSKRRGDKTPTHVLQDAFRCIKDFKMPRNMCSKQAKPVLLALAELYYIVYLCDTTDISLLGLAKDVYLRVCKPTWVALEDNASLETLDSNLTERVHQMNENMAQSIKSDDPTDTGPFIHPPKLVECTAYQLIHKSTNETKSSPAAAMPCKVEPILSLSVFTDTKNEDEPRPDFGARTRYVSTVMCDSGVLQGCCAPMKCIKLAPNSLVDVPPSNSVHHIGETQLDNYSVYEARVWKFHVAENEWHHRRTLVCLLNRVPLEVTETTPGASRYPVYLKLLSQGYFAGQYVGKFYKNPSSRRTTIIEVVAHEIARQYLSLFMEELEKRCPGNLTKIRMLPVQHVHVYGQDGTILDIMNVEPLVTPTGFTKITNNAWYVHPDLDTDLLLAFSHFTWSRSEGKLMVTDIQGWLPLDKRGFIILTDPLLHTLRHPVLSKLHGNQAQGGFKKFWTAQHRTCSDICRSLELDRDPQYP